MKGSQGSQRVWLVERQSVPYLIDERSSMFVTITEAAVDRAREPDLRFAWDALTTPLPDGFIESFLLRADDGTWRIVTVWESPEAVMAMRASGEPPAAPTMFERAGSTPAVSMWTVEGRVRARP
jgi:heme-degrading monooxygenase HmoA